MARIPQDELERLKREIDLVQLITSCGVKLSKKGNDLVGLCPMHSDKEPSLVVTPSKNLWHCLGACGTGGTVIDWVMKTQAVSFRHAVEILRGGGSVQSIRNAKRSTTPLLSCPISHDATGPKLIAQLMGFYHQELLQSKPALDYLEKRGINHPEAIARFKLGFVNRVLYYRLPTIGSTAGRAIREHLAAIGLTRKTGHEHFTGSVVFPIFDVSGEVVEIYGRRITNKGQPRHLYLPGPHRGIWNLDALRESKEIILCESLIDALTFWCAGYRHVTTTYGTNGFTTEIFEALKAYGIERVLIAFDRDDAGDAAAAKLAERLGAEGITCFRVLFPRGMDANEYALKVKPAEQSLGVLLRSAQHVAGPLVPLGNPHPADPTNSSVITDEKPSSSLAAAEEPSTLVKTEANTGSSARKAAKASPVPSVPAPDVPTEIRDHEVLLSLGDRRWRVRGLARNLSFEVLKVNLLVAKGEHFHVDSLDLYSARQRGTFLKQAVEELQIKSEILRKDLGAVLLKLEELQAAEIKKQLEPEEKVVTLSAEEEAQALELLKATDLLDRISDAFATCGLVGEHTNKLVGYLAAVSRKLTKPLAVMVQSSSAAGKSALMEAVLAFVPEEERVQYSAMTGQSLFYMGETDLQHKVLAIAEEEGAERASYALKLLQSEGKLSIASTGKDPSSGRLVTHEYHVEGPAAILLTTTAIDLDEELLNRCVVLAVDESREQTRAIHQLQRESRTLEGLEHRLARQDTVKLHQNAQRLLKPLFIVNP
ncbi:MAG: toprim domain-containing protein, partial [Thermoanaerobaculales bacterium]|nr:toprim domain-containing protein [Thermoanaerobaculales bacterium]